MADKRWIDDLFRNDEAERRARLASDERANREARAFESRLPAWTEKLKEEIHDAVNYFNEGLARQKRVHVIRPMGFANGVELMVAELPNYKIEVRSDERSIAYGFSGKRQHGMKLVLRDTDIEGQPGYETGWNGPGTEAEFLLRPYFEEARKRIT